MLFRFDFRAQLLHSRHPNGVFAGFDGGCPNRTTSSEKRNPMNKKTSVMVAVFVAAVSCALAAPDGSAIYMEKCKKCHGEKGEGNPKATEKLCKGVEPEKLKLDPIADKSDEEVKKLIVEGKDKMPKYAEKLTPEEIDAVVAFCRTLVPAKQ